MAIRQIDTCASGMQPFAGCGLNQPAQAGFVHLAGGFNRPALV
jgi:hypothetical protein